MNDARNMYCTLFATAGALLLAATAATASIDSVTINTLDIKHFNGWGQETADQSAPANWGGLRDNQVLDLHNGVQLASAPSFFQPLFNGQNPNAFSAAKGAVTYNFNQGTFDHMVGVTSFALTQNAMLNQGGAASNDPARLVVNVDIDWKFQNPLANEFTMPVAGWLFNLNIWLPGADDTAAFKLTGTWSTDMGNDSNVEIEENWDTPGLHHAGLLASATTFTMPAGSTEFKLVGLLELSVHHKGGEIPLGGEGDPYPWIEIVSGPPLPTPGALALLSVAGLLAGSRRRREQS